MMNPDYGSVGGAGYEEIPLMGQPRQQCLYQAGPPEPPPLRPVAPATPSERSFSSRLRTLASVASTEPYDIPDNVMQAVGQAFDNGGYMAPAPSNASVRLSSGDFTTDSDEEIDVEYFDDDDDDAFLASLPVFTGHSLVYNWVNYNEE